MRLSCVHQGYEMYGADRSFVETVGALRAGFAGAAIDVTLPRDGPIVAALKPHASRIGFERLWVLRRRRLGRLLGTGVVRLPAALARAGARFRASDLVFVNTSTVFDHLVAARLFPGRALVHVHEIPEGAVLGVLRALLLWSGAEIVFNSQATRTAFALPSHVRQHVIYNGIAGPAAVPPATYDGTRPLRVLMLGRINRIKGQETLIDAVAGLDPDHRARLRVKIAGSAYEDETAERRLAERLAAAGLGATVALLPFAPDPDALYRWADVVTMPSRRPESLGRVAIEALSYGRPVLASAIGGLREVVADGVTGWLVPPDDPAALGQALARILEAPSAWREFPAGARARYEALFSAASVERAMVDVVRRNLERRTRPAGGRAETDLGVP